jgi:hypothetical protein
VNGFETSGKCRTLDKIKEYIHNLGENPKGFLMNWEILLKWILELILS